MNVRAETSPRRRRRTPEAAQREIIDAAEGLLKERPFRDLTVDEVMRRTELSRPSFYVYFKDRHELVLRLVQFVFAEMVVPATPWLETGGAKEMRAGLLGASQIYQEVGHVLRALADAAADDPEVEKAYTDLVQRFIDLTRQRIEADIKAGRAPKANAGELATALVWMAERYLYLTYRTQPVETIADTLSTVFVRTIYGSP